jgi:hypothetical protein
MSKQTGGPAFPVPGLSNLPNGEFIYSELGMTLHDYFAAHVDVWVYTPMENLKVKLGRMPTVGELADYIASIRSIEADAMIKERGRV